jgi:Bacterial pre-peptidase C-terminal domain
MWNPRPIRLIAAAALIACVFPLARGDEPKDAAKKKDAPKVLCVAPLAVRPGAKTVVRLRGAGLETATEVRLTDAGPTTKAAIKSKGKADTIKGFDAKVVGDTQIEVELSVPDDERAGAELGIVVVTPAGETEPRKVPVLDAASVVQEKEPNDGFREAQPMEYGKTVLGAIGQEGDVDVFRLNGKAGRSIVAEVRAAKLGSPLDSLLTLYDARGQVVALNDDAPGPDGGKDSRLAATFPSDGVYFLALSDANDHGSPVHSYRLVVATRPRGATTERTGTTPTSAEDR